MSQINISNLTFAYDGSYDNIFENTSIKLDTDWKTGFIGRNGRGKTTFLNLLMGKYEYSGSISASTDFEYFPFVTPNDCKFQNTIDIVEQICPGFEHWKLALEFNNLKLSEDILYRPFSTLSGGEQTKVQLASLFLKDNSFLLIDEPTNHLDILGRELVAKYLKSKRGFVLVSHDRVFLDNIVDHTISINKSEIKIEKGNFSSWFLNKEQQDNFELAKNERLKKEVNRLSESAKRNANWSNKLEKTKNGTRNSGLRPDRGYIGSRSARMMKRSTQISERREKSISEKKKLLKNIETADDLKVMQEKYKSKLLLSLDDVSIKYGSKTVCNNLRFSIESGDMISLSGKNGSGKSSVLNLILGKEIEYSGNFIKGTDLNISYIPQDTSFISGDLSEYARLNNIDETQFKTILRKLDFSRIQFEKDISSFSQGQKKKVLIAKNLCEKSHLLVWDEPLNYVDIFSRIQIENLLSEFKPTIIFVEHDKQFCDKLATKTILI